MEGANLFNQEHLSFRGRRFLVTAGPTVEAIDPVRFISNHSTGKMGYAVAAELAARGADVVLVSGPVSLATPQGVGRVDVTSADDMFRRCTELWPAMDGAVMCAAVADYTPAKVSATKIKKGLAGEMSHSATHAHGELTLLLRPTRDIAAELGRTKRAGQVLVGFALETDNEQANALAKMERKRLDAVVLNSLRDPGAGFGGDTNRITIFTRGADGGAWSGVAKNSYPLAPKAVAAAHIVDAIERL
jgi:phosphopantothenoylcysteine decarboxylase/phosphopantothenate--cysteine ligase